MRRLLNTLFVMTEDSYLSLENGNIVVRQGDNTLGQIPLLTLENFAYTILAHDCASAFEAVGLDAYVGFLHSDRPGRPSLALDLMEELRAIYADRFVLKLINNRMVKPSDFEEQENGAALLNENGRKRFLQEWQEKKREMIVHPFLEEKMAWGLIPYAQALLLARHLRGDLEEYPALMWK